MWIPPEDFDLMLIHRPNRKHIAFFGAVYAADGRLVESRIGNSVRRHFSVHSYNSLFMGRSIRKRSLCVKHTMPAHNACKNKCFDVSQNERFMGDKEKTTFSTYCSGWQYMQAYDYVPDCVHTFYLILFQYSNTILKNFGFQIFTKHSNTIQLR